ncbi:Hypothetical protein RG1141_PA14450 (plasmid) [Neorhizobium galegae bv. officinalis bv. officinalis str. HAMBI 1141]|uniref:Uncharacterized protein n=1 Tax=Neorhizobium galegae bv. officinalis bv. officinalis str. HAMBI 1141 TaxID=1028801 RepID=A0A068TIJ4_NEOGA|nr:Hypothetical protein RG1141_PA14450 [Neorhizobium galegae bv. officinalis bv. officinalis str. HAMBI 1141]
MKFLTKPFTVQIKKRRGLKSRDARKSVFSKLLDKVRSETAAPAARS